MKMRYIRIAVIVLFIISLAGFIATDRMITAKQDRTAPVITCNIEELKLSVKDDPEKLIEGITAADNQDGDLTSEIMIQKHSRFAEKGVTNVTYLVFDSSNNAAEYTRKVYYTDYESPKFSLEKPVLYTAGTSITILDRLTAQDVLDGDISDKIRILSSNVNASVSGIYQIRAEVTNSYADTVTIELPIVVSGRFKGPEIALTDYLVYLEKGSTFEAKDYLKSVDGRTEDIIESVKIDSEVDTKKAGSYVVIYSCENGDAVGYSCLAVIVTEED